MTPRHLAAFLIGIGVLTGTRLRAEKTGDVAKLRSGEAIVLRANDQVANFDAANGRIVISTGEGDQRRIRVEASFESVKKFTSCKQIQSGDHTREGIEIRGDSGEVEFTVFVDDHGIFEFKPDKAVKLTLRDLRLQYGMVPSLVGTDFLYDPKTLTGTERVDIPALSMILGMVEGEDCMAVGVWPPGKQSAAFEVKSEKQSKRIDGFSLDTAGQSFYLAFVEKPGIWHAEPLKREFLEKETVIGWKRPFEGKWLGRFFITSDEYDWPFYFDEKPAKIWGRYIEGWYDYPLRFDGEKTIVHFEKRFKPKGELLIYCLEPHPSRPNTSVLRPAEIMARALGQAEADRILDPEGTVEQTILNHRLAVCAMTNTMQGWFNEGKAAEHREQIVQWCGDVASFIRTIRQRDQAFADFARDTNAMVADMAKAEPTLEKSAAELQASLAKIEQTTKQQLPTTDLETVQQWTEEMTKAADDTNPDMKVTFRKLGGECRGVAGTQDDLARDLSIAVIRLTEQAARIGVQSPKHARMAREVILKARQLLRKPTWWEPTRRFNPKSDPGNVK